MVGLIKKAALDAIAESKPVAVLFGEVSGINPIKITVEQKLVLIDKVLIFMNGTRWLSQTKDKEEVGRKVILLQMQGGQKFIVLEVME